MSTFRIVNEIDPSESFSIEARSYEEAAFQALGYLGWAVDMSIPEEEDDMELGELISEFEDLDELESLPPDVFENDMPPEEFE